MKRLLLCLLLSVASVIPCLANDILLKNGECVHSSDILSKDQFGIVVKVSVDEKTGKTLRTFIPFYDLNSASLSNFAFCDVKAIERTYAAVQDRAQLAQRKFATKVAEYKDQKDYRTLLQIHSGVPSYKVMFVAYKPAETGLIGYMYSDTAEMQFYGIIYLYGLIGNGNDVFTGEIYPTVESIELEGITYPVFSVIPPEKNESANEAANRTREGKDSNAVGPGGEGNMPPPPPMDGNMPPPPKDGQQPPMPPKAGDDHGKDGKERPHGPRPAGKNGPQGQMPPPGGAPNGGGPGDGGPGGGGPGGGGPGGGGPMGGGGGPGPR